MKEQSNIYTFLYSAAVVLVVATFLALFATALKPVQLKNVEIEKKQNILASVRVSSGKENVERLFSEYIIDSYTLKTSGDKIPDVDPFQVDLREELKKPISERNLPAFVCEKNDSMFLIVPVYGKGLWGPIWGYVSFMKQDSVPDHMPYYNTVYGVNFDHQGETPGLGAEITQPFFQIPFRGKSIFDDQGNFVSISIIKGEADPGSRYEVDGISGGTITSKGLEAMLDTCLTAYEKYFKSGN